MRRTTWLVLGFLLLPVRASMAQMPAHSFEQLRVLVAQGDTLLVTDETGREVTGRLTDLAAASLTLEVGGAPRTWEAADIRRIRQRHGDSLLNGTLIGAGVSGGLITAAVIATCGQSDTTCDGGEVALALVFYTAAGAGIGALVDAAIRGRRVVYEAPAASPPAVTLAPLVLPHGVGLQARLRF